MKTSRFSAGDRVRCIDHAAPLEFDRQYEVTRVVDGAYPGVQLRGMRGWYYDTHFVLVEKRPRGTYDQRLKALELSAATIHMTPQQILDFLLG